MLVEKYKQKAGKKESGDDEKGETSVDHFLKHMAKADRS